MTDTGLSVSTSIHSGKISQRQQRILGAGGKVGPHISAQGDTSSNWDTDASITYRYTRTVLKLTCTMALMRYNRKGHCSECGEL